MKVPTTELFYVASWIKKYFVKKNWWIVTFICKNFSCTAVFDQFKSGLVISDMKNDCLQNHYLII